MMWRTSIKTYIFFRGSRSKMEERKASFLSEFKLTRAKTASDCARSSAVIVKTAFIPPDFSFATLHQFLSSHEPRFVFAAMERIKGDNSIVVGYPSAEVAPFSATELLKFLVTCRIHPEIYTTKSPAHEIRDFIEQMREGRNIEFVLADEDRETAIVAQIDDESEPEPEPEPELEPTAAESQTWWTSIGATTWEPQTADVFITPNNEIEAALRLYGSVACDQHTSYKKMKIRMKNTLLQLPDVDAHILECAVAHQSIFDM